jgi:nucleoside phosphorylase
VNLVVALPAEAKPVIAKFGLRRRPDRGFPLYQGKRLSLVLSGPGKAAAAAATRWLWAQTGYPGQAVWLNLGIAGHRDRPLGQAVLAARILDVDSGDQWDLPRRSGIPVERETLITLDRPGNAYPKTGALEMEAAGFYAMARRFSPPERIHCLKVISDNAANPTSRIDGAKVRQWLTAHLATLELLLRWLDE